MAKWIVLLLAITGLIVGIWMVSNAREDLPRPAPAQPPSVNPFPEGVAATGIVEAASRNIAIAPPEPGLVTEVYVQTGADVEADQPLFQLDPRSLQAELLTAQGTLATAQAELARLRAMPRPEDVPPLEAAVNRARARVADATQDFQRLTELYQSGAANMREMLQAQYAKDATEAELSAARAELARMNAGAWEQQIAIAQAEVQRAQAAIDALDIRMKRLTVRSPIAGTVIKRNIEAGEYASPNTADPAMVVGDLSHLHVRAQIDEDDVVLVRPGAEARARPRGQFDRFMPLTMIRIEPLAIPKRQITGLPMEQIDTRVVEAIFRIEDTRGLPIYPGQLIDVYISTPDAVDEPASPTAPSADPTEAADS